MYADALRDGRIVFQQCTSCQEPVWYLRTVCPKCMSSDLVVTESRGLGTVYTLTTLLRAGDPARAEDVPYSVGLVDLDEGIRVIGELTREAAAAGIGGRVVAAADETGVTFAPVTP
ncbi:Zn-ribbon domain-containing OB-fold protein [Gryllotalpicola reticulitermitis]|uniref:Zn-ribbon domain-containing OB-fold protein n=1 Tax=Gryllotalpicola reticulitermitis TaxID=1184153 RepID=A0ABV8Q2Z9_9MICO